MEHAKLPLEMPETKKNEGPVTCLGMTFENDQERREYFTEILRQKLPELKKIEGYPIGEDEDILALSDPPYYTACPNPFLSDFIEEWKQERKKHYGGGEEEYHREPFAADVSEGKNDPIYNAHSYHTKVPHKAIMRYILHYTNPGDIVLDGFAGSGMTGVAVQRCADKSAVEELEMSRTSRVGKRNCVLNDLSPIASFLSYNYNYSEERNTFLELSKRIISQLEKEFRWVYETNHYENNAIAKDKGRINYTVWSDVFACSHCSNEFVYWDVAVGEDLKVKTDFQCPHCNVSLTRRTIEKLWVTEYDQITGQHTKQPRQVPVLISYDYRGKRYEKCPDKDDLSLIQRILDMDINEWVPLFKIPDGEKTKELHRQGITTTDKFYTKRTLLVLSSLWQKVNQHHFMKFLFTATVVNLGKTARYKFKRSGNVPLTGTIYIPSLQAESNVIKALKTKAGLIARMTDASQPRNSMLISTQSMGSILMPADSIDYIFTDPPFGSNLMYSDLNFVWESWLQVHTNSVDEAIVNRTQEKEVGDYQRLMEKCFKEYFRILKPARWMTVVFSNSQAGVWNAIHESLQRSGFVIANVSALNKKQGSYNAIMSPTAVKQDLVISAYKPSETMVREMREKVHTEGSAWVFVRRHLEQLPVFVGSKGEAELIVERTPRVLFDRMVAYHVQNGYSVPISSAEFQEGVAQRFPMRDGMAFLETQVIEYDKKRLLAKEFVQTTLFVSDENSAIEWLRQQLMQKPQTRQDLHPNFMKELQHISKHELLPELDVLLEQNFLMYDGTGPVPSQIHAYLSTDFKDLRNLEKDDPKLQAKAKNRWYVPDPNKQADLEKLRERSLLREFNSYIEELGKSKKKLRQFRTEAIRAGFKTAWGNQDYQTIVDVGQRLPEKVLQEDSTMLMYYDNAQVRLGM